MSANLVNQLLKPDLEKIDICLGEAQLAQLQRLLTAMLADRLYPSVSKILAPEEIISKHFLDSLAPLRFDLAAWKAQHILDLGTGGGFPCLPLAIALPHSQFIAVDSRKKSVDFVARMAAAVGLKNVTVCHSRIEDIGRDNKFREKSDLVVCRALSALRTLIEFALPLVKNGGSTLFYKGPKLEAELADSTQAFKEFNILPDDVQIFRLAPPDLPFERNFIAVGKTHTVAEKYPRKSGLPVSKPL